MKYLQFIVVGLCLSFHAHTQDSAWYREYGGAAQQVARKIIALPDGDMAILVQTYGAPTGPQLRLSKVRSNGDLVWENIIDEGDDFFPQDFAVSSSGNFMIVSNSNNNFTADRDIRVHKVDSSGLLIWRKWLELDAAIYATSIIATEDDSFLIGGSIAVESITPFNERYDDYFLLKIDIEGLIPWTLTNTKVGIDESLGGVISVAESEGIYYAFTEHGFSHGEVAVVRLNEMGELIDETTLTQMQIPVRALLTAEKAYLVYNHQKQFTAQLLNAEGNTIWEKTYDAASDLYSSDNFHAVNGIDDGYLLVQGGSKATAPEGSIHLSKIDDAGERIWERSIATTGIPIVRDIDISTDEHYIMTGLADVIFTGIENADYFALKLGQEGLIDSDTVFNVEVISSVESVINNRVTVFPNPTTDYLQVELDQSYTDLHFRLYDSSGRLVFQQIYTSTSFQVALPNQRNQGNYFYTLSTQNQWIGEGQIIWKE